MSSAIVERTFEPDDDLATVGELQAAVCDGCSCTVATQTLEAFAVV